MSNKYLSDKELLQIYGITHPNESLSTRGEQIKALNKMRSMKKTEYDKYYWIVLGTIIGLFLLGVILFGNKLIYLPLFI
ncbi:MAG: hypothetical protein IKO45_04950 [Clostridia bacterium]|nr:hypothetical protein [Clostridia bacterium]MBR4623882.1 hypothetical protein [Clostridia bacterium]